MMRVLAGFVFFLLAGYVQAFDYLQPLPPVPPSPADNQPTQAKIQLGKQLFFDSRLSYAGRTSCNHCHNILAGGSDGRPLSIGDSGQANKRHTPSLWNVAYQSVYFWDGRATSLELALQEHLLQTHVMGMPNKNTLVGRLKAIEGYAKAYQQVFTTDLTFDGIAKALSAYIRTLITPNSPFDRYIRGDKTALTDKQQRGMTLFREAQCLACHFGINFSGPAPGPAMNMGDGFYELFPNYRGTVYEKRLKIADDLGRYTVTGDPGHKLMWRVPSLRNIALSAPYFHNGSADSLQQAVTVMAATQRQRTLTAKEVDLLIAFLNSLTGEYPSQTMPLLPPTPNKAVP